MPLSMDNMTVAAMTESLRPHLTLTAAVTLTSILVGTVAGTMVYTAMDRVVSSRIYGYRLAAMMGHFQPQEFAEVAAGPAPTSNQEVLQVDASEGHLWRGHSCLRRAGSVGRPVAPALRETTCGILRRCSRY